MSMRIWNHEPRHTTIWTGDTPRVIGMGSFLECDPTFGAHLLELAKARGIKWSAEPPIPGAVEMRAQQENLLKLAQVVRENCLVLPATVFGAEDWRTMSKATLARVSTALGMPVQPPDATKADAVEAIINFIAGSTNGKSSPHSGEVVGSTPTPATTISDAAATAGPPPASPGAQNTGATNTPATQDAQEKEVTE